MNLEERTAEEKYLRRLFSEHYSKGRITIVKPEQRELGFGGWDKKIEFRHIAVRSEEALRAKLVAEAPLYVSHSVGYYEFPDARPMIRKNWLGADLVFDLDAEGHDCGKFTCQTCLDTVKQDAIKLIEEFLLPDFGFSKSEIWINFSGSRGYHVHVRSDTVRSLDREARREIADYVTGTGLSFSTIFGEETAKKKVAEKKYLGPLPSDGGYKGKIARAVQQELQNEKTELAHLLSSKLRDPAKRERFLQSINTEIRAEGEDDLGKSSWDPIGIGTSSNNRSQRFQAMYEFILKKYTLAGRIDANVTADSTKLIRMADSIHGGSGFAAACFQHSELSGFDPMNDAPVFRQGSLKVKTVEAVPALCVADFSFGPLEKDKTLELPQASAVYLLCKKAAVLA